MHLRILIMKDQKLLIQKYYCKMIILRLKDSPVTHRFRNKIMSNKKTM